MDNVEIIKQTYQNFATGNIEAVLASFNENIEWHECKGLPFGNGGEPIVGPGNVVSTVFAAIPEYFEGFNIEVLDLFGSGNKVGMIGYYVGKYLPTGKTFKANASHTWTLEDGKATMFFQAVDTAEIIDP